jgi:VanZ family protein
MYRAFAALFHSGIKSASAADNHAVRLVWASLAVAWALLLLFVGSRPGESLPQSRILSLPGADKVFHALAYGLLGALVARAAAPRAPRRALLLGALAGLAWGMLDEWVQGQVPGRTRSWADLLFDTAGASIGGFLGRSRPRAPSATMSGPHPQGEGP